MDAYTKARSIAEKKRFIHSNHFRTKEFPLLYLRYRLMRPLLKAYNKLLLKKWRNQIIPWLAPAAIEILDNLLQKDMTGFEYGSGNSTLFLAARIRKLVSVEHDENWFKRVQGLLEENRITNVEYRLITADKNYTCKLPRNSYEDYTMPATDAKSFHNYYTSIRAYPDESFDFILVDGRARVSCVHESLVKLKPGGLLILDNADRFRYKEIHILLKDWKKILTTTGLTDTVFWFKP